jgi:hypothetical protein
MINKTKQTAVDSIIEFCQKQMDNDSSIHKGVYLSIIKFCEEQAKEMEKEQMWEYIKKNYCIGHRSLEFHLLEFEEYFEETYGGNK